jgi:hypothetical protein
VGINLHEAKVQRFQWMKEAPPHNFQKLPFNYTFEFIIMKTKRALSIGVLAVFLLSLSACSLFRKKNKCMSCPTWKDNVELEAKTQNNKPESSEAGIESQSLD